LRVGTLLRLLLLRAGLRRRRLGDRPLPLTGDGVSKPAECRFDGKPWNRGISSGVTTSTTIASGGGSAWKALAPTKNEPTIRAARWPMTETASPGRMYRFNPIIRD
jgi:hypothetical protein